MSRACRVRDRKHDYRAPSARSRECIDRDFLAARPIPPAGEIVSQRQIRLDRKLTCIVCSRSRWLLLVFLPLHMGITTVAAHRVLLGDVLNDPYPAVRAVVIEAHTQELGADHDRLAGEG